MKEKKRELIDFLREDDSAFYEHYLKEMTAEEYERFLEETPEFSVRKE